MREPAGVGAGESKHLAGAVGRRAAGSNSGARASAVGSRCSRGRINNHSILARLIFARPVFWFAKPR